MTLSDFYTYSATFLACYVVCVALFEEDIFLKAILATSIIFVVSLLSANGY